MVNLYNPIISKEELSRWDLLNKIPVPDANTALVFVGNGQPTVTITEGQKGLTRGEIIWGKYNLVYKINLSDFSIAFGCKLPCATDAFDFQADVQFICSVREPEMIVRSNTTNIYSALQPLIIDEMRRISRRYEVEESGLAEQEIRDKLRTQIYAEGFNFKTLHISLFLEEEARERIRRKKRLLEEHELEKIRLEQETEIQIQRNKQERQEVKSSLLDEMEIQMLRQNLEKQRKLFEEEQARRQELFQLEMLKQKADFYSTMLQAGQWQMFALQLAQNPQDVHLIVERLNQQKQSEREHQMKMLKILIDTDAVEGWQLSEIGKRALHELVGLTEQTTPALEEASLEDTSSNNNKEQTSDDKPTAEEVFPE